MLEYFYYCKFGLFLVRCNNEFCVNMLTCLRVLQQLLQATTFTGAGIALSSQQQHKHAASLSMAAAGSPFERRALGSKIAVAGGALLALQSMSAPATAADVK
jgi:hypothetical protein